MASEFSRDRLQQLAVRWLEHSVGLVERALRLTALLQGGRYRGPSGQLFGSKGVEG